MSDGPYATLQNRTREGGAFFVSLGYRGVLGEGGKGEEGGLIDGTRTKGRGRETSSLRRSAACL